MDPEAVARHMYANDASATAFGIELVTASPDRAVVRMLVRADMCNGFRIVHGGVTFLLADSAMAFASNSENVMALASSAEIDWLAPVEAGQILTATAERRWSSGRSTVWDITVRAHSPGHDDGHDVAVVRGRTRQVGKPVVDT
jgi:acyl-CoA thioesterase